eukprot:gene3575-5555_t
MFWRGAPPPPPPPRCAVKRPPPPPPPRFPDKRPPPPPPPQPPPPATAGGRALVHDRELAPGSPFYIAREFFDRFYAASAVLPPLGNLEEYCALARAGASYNFGLGELPHIARVPLPALLQMEAARRGCSYDWLRWVEYVRALLRDAAARGCSTKALHLVARDMRAAAGAA